jgi:L-fuculose-phosphate aldolase
VSDVDVRTTMVEICRWLAQHDYVAADDGAVSARVSPNEILITPQGIGLGQMMPDHMVAITGKGERVAGDLPPSPTVGLHVAIYGNREEIQAVIFAQPPAATAFAVAGIPLVQPVIPEALLTLGTIPLAPYATPFTTQAARAIEELISSHDAVLLKNRGVLTLGISLWNAHHNMERVEKLASILMKAKVFGHLDLLSGNQVKELIALRRQMRLSGKNTWLDADPEDRDA